ncbi:MAG TPA: hypothetical protein VFG46_25920 [Chryseolinea sp.]|nr:hypothetical protein [Chryseolinea sp.]
MKKLLLSVFVVVGATTFYGCSSNSEKKVDEAGEAIKQDIKNEKEEVARDLRALRDDINDRLDKVSKKIDQAGDKSKTELENVKRDLDNQREEVERTLDEVEQTTDSTWVDIKESTKARANEVKTEFEELRQRVENALSSD